LRPIAEKLGEQCRELTHHRLTTIATGAAVAKASHNARRTGLELDLYST